MAEIVVGFDGSTESRAALRWAHRLATARGCGVRAVRAWQYPASAGTPAGATTLPPPSAMDALVEEQLDKDLAQTLGADAAAVTPEVARGGASGVLVHRASSDRAAALVVGARGVGGFEGLLLGSTSRQCLEHAPCPVVVVRELADDGAPALPSRIVVGVDGSHPATAALSWAADLARDLDAEVIAVHALGTRVPARIAERARTFIEGDGTRALRDADVRYHAHVEDRDPRAALLYAAERDDADLIVVGARGKGPLQTVLLGSVAAYVATHATRPVAVVPDPCHPTP